MCRIYVTAGSAVRMEEDDIIFGIRASVVSVDRTG